MKQATLDPEIVEALPARRETVESEASAMLGLIERVARDPTVDIARLEALLAMRREIMSDEARRAFSTAMAAVQLELPSTIERGVIDIGRGKPMHYALWEDINEGIKPVLARHGFALTFRTGRDGDRISVTGILSHAAGHTEETTMLLPLDQSGSKNAVQAVGSSTSYGKRYTASALLNLTSRGEDDDGRGGKVETLSDEQCAQLADLITEYKADKARFCKFFGIASLADLPASRYDEAVAALEAKAKETRK
jgi:ERF superfamily